MNHKQDWEVGGEKINLEDRVVGKLSVRLVRQNLLRRGWNSQMP
jgi:hypothetical protein